LANEIAKYLGVSLGKLSLDKFPDGEINVEIGENVRGRDVFVVQSIALAPNEYLMELLIIIDALKRASAKSIAAVIPYFGYSRQDRKDKPRVPITAKLVANMLVNAGAARIVTMDLHTGQLEGFFDIPVDHLHARPELAKAVGGLNLNRCMVATADVGSIKLARDMARHLGVDLAIVDKHRISATCLEKITVIGDVEGKDILLADDMCSTASTLTSAAKACREKGATRVFAAVTHGLFVSDAIEKLEESALELLLVTNTIASTDKIRGCKKIATISVASLFGQAIDCILSAGSISTQYIL
jgi:ribose-phosphate pyrophosphokinase